MATNRLRIVHIAKYFPPDPGGMEYFVRDLAYEQAKAGHEVLVLAHAGQTPAGVTLERPGLTVKRFKVWTVLGNYAPAAPALFLALKAVVRNFNPDIIHLHCPNPLEAAIFLLPAALPLVLHWHADVCFPPEHEPSRWLLALWRRIEGTAMERANRIIATSGLYAESSLFLVPHKDKVKAIPVGLPPDMPSSPQAGRAAGWLAARPLGSRLVAIGRLSYYKGFSVLLEAMSALKDAFLCLIGEGPERGHLEKTCDRLGLRDRVFFAGQVDDNDREAALKLADIFVLPSLNRGEAFGLVLLEAMRAGKACLATDVPGSGMSFVVQDGVTGLLAEPNDCDSLSEKAALLLNNRRMREELGMAGRKRFLDNFTLPVVHHRIELLYDEMIKPS